MNLLLDTCTFLWFISADPQLPEPLVSRIRSARFGVWLSVVSFWEVQVKHQLGKLALDAPPATVVPRERHAHGIASLALDEPAVSNLGKLPPLHRDPFDRMLICQAIEHSLVLVTPDEAIRAYPVKTLWS